MDLDISKGHLVAVIKKQDPMGNSTSWFVDNGGRWALCIVYVMLSLVEVSCRKASMC